MVRIGLEAVIRSILASINQKASLAQTPKSVRWVLTSDRTSLALEDRYSFDIASLPSEQHTPCGKVSSTLNACAAVAIEHSHPHWTELELILGADRNKNLFPFAQRLIAVGNGRLRREALDLTLDKLILSKQDGEISEPFASSYPHRSRLQSHQSVEAAGLSCLGAARVHTESFDLSDCNQMVVPS